MVRRGRASVAAARATARGPDRRTPPPPPSAFPAGTAASVGIHPSNVKITKLTRLDRDRMAFIARKVAGKKGKVAADAMVA